MSRPPLPTTALAIHFIDCINRGDLEGLGAMIGDDHRLIVHDEAPLVGRRANLDAWSGYFSSFPDYVIHPRYVAASGGRVAVLGTTTGSHLGLADEDEVRLDVVWVAEVTYGQVSVWRVAEDTPELRAEVGIPSTL